MKPREYPAQDITSLLNNLRSQYVYLIQTGKRIGDPNIGHPQSLLTHALHNLTRTLNISSSQHSIANPRPTTTRQYARYARALTIYSYPVTKVDKSGTSRMSESCDLLRHVLTKSPTSDCPIYASLNSSADTPSTCSGCVVYALIHQITFTQRCNDIQLVVIATQASQIHTSLNSPQPMASETTPQRTNEHIVLSLISRANLTPTPTRLSITLAMIKHTLGEIRQVLTATPSLPLCAKVHIHHPA